MSIIINSTVEIPVQVPLPDVQLIETDGEPLETGWHHVEISLLIDIVTCLYSKRNDFYVGGNMFVYFSEEQARNRDYKGPDFFFVDGVDRWKERRWWAVWQEAGRYPDLIVELLSPSTAQGDRTTKKDLYERTFHTSEYFCYDPDDQKLEGWRLNGQFRYQPIPANERGWLWSERFQLWLGTWTGEYLGMRATWLRFYDKNGNLVPTSKELEQHKAEAERHKTDAERQKAESERQRAEAAEAELARLRQRLCERENGPQADSI